MEIRPRDVRHYETPDGRDPFQEWLSGLKDKKARSAVLTRIDRLRSGNLGDAKRVSGDVYELRIHYGAGYRVYFGDLDGETVMVLFGGSKRTQKRDFQNAAAYLKEFRVR